MVVKILSGLGVLLAVFLLYAYFSPKGYEVSKQVIIQAQPDEIFSYLNNPQLMDQWSPWVEMDPDLQMNYSGPEEGLGARAEWKSDGKMGVGSATIIESIENQLVRTQLEYVEPFQMVQMAELSVRSEGEQSVVTWSVRGENNFIGRIFCILMNGEKMIGSTFESGLLNLKKIVESR